MKDIYIIGAGGSGRELAEIIKDINEVKPEFNILGFIDDNEQLWEKEINGFKVFGGVEYFKQLCSKDKKNAVISIADCQVKENIVNKLGDGVCWCNIIHPTAKIFSFVEMGVGNIIEPFVFIGPNAKLGDHVFINSKSNIGHDAVIGDYSSLMCFVDITGNVVLNKNVFVSSHVSVIPGVVVGESAKLGAGAVIIKDVRPEVTMHGHMAVEAK